MAFFKAPKSQEENVCSCSKCYNILNIYCFSHLPYLCTILIGIGLLPYSERLEILGLATLAEHRARGDLIEVYKAKHNFSFTNNVFKFGRSGLNLLSKFCPSSNAKCNTI